MNSSFPSRSLLAGLAAVAVAGVTLLIFRPVGSPALPGPAVVHAAAEAAPVRPGSPADAWAMFGGSPGRNMVNLTDKNVPDDWGVKKGEEKKEREPVSHRWRPDSLSV